MQMGTDCRPGSAGGVLLTVLQQLMTIVRFAACTTRLARGPVALLFLAGVWASPAIAQDEAGNRAIPELDVEYVIGHPHPRVAEIGYKQPEVFDPFTDKLYQSGFRYGGPSVEIPQEARYLSAIGRTKMLKRILACADAWYYPFSHTAPKSEPPGIDIEILSRIAQRHGWQFSILWANTGVYRGGVNLAFKQTINRGFCDVFLGLAITGVDDHMTRNDMAFTTPYLGVGFVLVSQGKVPKVRTLAELKGQGFKIGVPAYSPMYDNAVELGIPVETYFQNHRVIDGLLRHEVDAVMVWGPSITVANHDKNVELHMSEGFQPMPGQRFNMAWAVKAKETEFKKMLDDSINEMLADGEIREIVERYDVPYFAPFPEGR
ncbi:MAG: transporter substrate-binding domain-containing protein [Betaproteobacteria bacterium]|nr:transporter substrate-binding domain-containing protein [Betaproteobacteria bacterium]